MTYVSAIPPSDLSSQKDTTTNTNIESEVTRVTSDTSVSPDLFVAQASRTHDNKSEQIAADIKTLDDKSVGTRTLDDEKTTAPQSDDKVKAGIEVVRNKDAAPASNSESAAPISKYQKDVPVPPARTSAKKREDDVPVSVETTTEKKDVETKMETKGVPPVPPVSVETKIDTIPTKKKQEDVPAARPVTHVSPLEAKMETPLVEKKHVLVERLKSEAPPAEAEPAAVPLENLKSEAPPVEFEAQEGVPGKNFKSETLAAISKVQKVTVETKGEKVPIEKSKMIAKTKMKNVPEKPVQKQEDGPDKPKVVPIASAEKPVYAEAQKQDEILIAPAPAETQENVQVEQEKSVSAEAENVPVRTPKFVETQKPADIPAGAVDCVSTETPKVIIPPVRAQENVPTETQKENVRTETLTLENPRVGTQASVSAETPKIETTTDTTTESETPKIKTQQPKVENPTSVVPDNVSTRSQKKIEEPAGTAETLKVLHTQMPLKSERQKQEEKSIPDTTIASVPMETETENSIVKLMEVERTPQPMETDTLVSTSNEPLHTEEQTAEPAAKQQANLGQPNANTITTTEHPEGVNTAAASKENVVYEQLEKDKTSERGSVPVEHEDKHATVDHLEAHPENVKQSENVSKENAPTKQSENINAPQSVEQQFVSAKSDDKQSENVHERNVTATMVETKDKQNTVHQPEKLELEEAKQLNTVDQPVGAKDKQSIAAIDRSEDVTVITVEAKKTVETKDKQSNATVDQHENVTATTKEAKDKQSNATIDPNVTTTTVKAKDKQSNAAVDQQKITSENVRPQNVTEETTIAVESKDNPEQQPQHLEQPKTNAVPDQTASANTSVEQPQPKSPVQSKTDKPAGQILEQPKPVEPVEKSKTENTLVEQPAHIAESDQQKVEKPAEENASVEYPGPMVEQPLKMDNSAKERASVEQPLVEQPEQLKTDKPEPTSEKTNDEPGTVDEQPRDVSAKTQKSSDSESPGKPWSGPSDYPENTTALVSGSETSASDSPSAEVSSPSTPLVSPSSPAARRIRRTIQRPRPYRRSGNAT